MGNKAGQKSKLSPFDEAIHARITNEIDNTLAKSNDSTGPGKRKRQALDAKQPKRTKRQFQTSAEVEYGKVEWGHNKKLGNNTARTTLLEEIRALGGSEEDLELLAGIDSDTEDRPGRDSGQVEENPVDDAFKKELAKFTWSLGFQNLPGDHEIESTSCTSIDNKKEVEQEETGVADGDGLEDEKNDILEDSGNILPREVTRKGKNGGLIFEPRPDWHSLSTEQLSTAVPKDIRPYSAVLASLKTHARNLLDNDTAAYNSGQVSSSSRRFMSTIMSSGTLSDKVSALTLAIQESPLHNMKAFETLMTLAAKRSRGQAIAALRALVDLLGSGLVLPKDRRLRPFYSQPGLLGSLYQYSVTSWSAGERLPGEVTEAHIVMWAYEDWLKDAYFRVIQLLEIWCADEIEYSRLRALDFVFGLLRDKPEQEANLLRLLANKLGDRDRKTASRASYLLLQLLNIHPGMKPIVIRTIELEVILRPGQTLRAKYYAINMLNQTILSSKEPSVADTLVRIYFDMFMSLLKDGSLGAVNSPELSEQAGTSGERPKKKANAVSSANDLDSVQKLISSVLTGINRAIPFTATDDSTLEKHLDILFRVTHSSNFNTSVQALVLIQQLAVSRHLVVERFYRTLYESLLDRRLLTSSKQALYLNLLFRALKNDTDVRRVKAFVKRMLQMASLHQPSFICGVLFLVAELRSTFPDLKTLFDMPEQNEEDLAEVYKDEPENGFAEKQTGLLGGDDGQEGRRRYVYDGRKRDPEYSNADKSCLWELAPYFCHFHPSVTVFASNLVTSQKSLPKPELANHTLMHFLDKFVYRNPKAADSKRGGSIMQPVPTVNSTSRLVVPGRASGSQHAVVNSASFWNLKPDQVAAEDVFFHQYYAQIGRPARASEAKQARNGPESGSDEEGEEEIWEALVNSRHDLEKTGDSDTDGEIEGGSGFDIDSDGEELDLDSDFEGSTIDELGAAASVSDSSGRPVGFEGIFDDSSEEHDERNIEADDSQKAVASKGRVKTRLSRKEMKNLPMFASVDDYAELLGAEEDNLDNQ